jgi:hypothetical protein
VFGDLQEILDVFCLIAVLHETREEEESDVFAEAREWAGET